MIGIVIVNYCTWEATKKCVASIKDNCEMPYRVYIVDNDSPNDSMMQLRAFYANDETVKLFSSGKNGGYGYGLNYGIDKAIRDDCDAVIASNNDIHYMPGAISNMYDCLKSDDSIGCVGPSQLSMTGEAICSAQITHDTKLRWACWYFTPMAKIEIRKYCNRLRKKRRFQAYCPMGGCYMLRTSAMPRHGFFEESVFMYCEENILGFKLKSAGYKVMISPKAAVIHEHGKTSGHSKSKRKVESVESLLWYGKNCLKSGYIARKLFFFFLRLNLILTHGYTRENRLRLMKLQTQK